MKKQTIKTLVFMSLIGFSCVFNACKPTCDPDDPNSDCYVKPVVHEKGTATLVDEIKGQRTLSADTTYLLQGMVYVTDGATLTIPAGTILKQE